VEGYVPDAVLLSMDTAPVLVEVKPVVAFPLETSEKIDSSGWDGGNYVRMSNGLHTRTC
jgi:hypothetical protein